MKTIVVFFLLLISSIYPQRETLSDKMEYGGFGGPKVKFTSIKSNFGVLVGAYGGWLINHTLLIGGGGYGLANNIRADNDVQSAFGFNQQPYINFGYGGAVFEYYFKPDKLLHYSVSLLIGGGEASYRSVNDISLNGSNLSYDNADVFFVLEPGIGGELNATGFLKIGVSLTYRLVSGINMYGLKNSDLSNFSAGIAFKFGSF